MRVTVLFPSDYLGFCNGTVGGICNVSGRTLQRSFRHNNMKKRYGFVEDAEQSFLLHTES